MFAELKELIRTEPSVADTFAAVEAEYASIKAHFDAIGRKRSELKSKLDAIAKAKRELAASFAPEQSKGEPAPSLPPADKPVIERKRT